MSTPPLNPNLQTIVNAIPQAQADFVSLKNQVDDLTKQNGDFSNQLATAGQGVASLASDLVAGRKAVITFKDLHKLPGLLPEKQGQWTDPGGTKADSNPSTTVRAHGTGFWTMTGAVTVRFGFQPAAAQNAQEATHNDNCYAFTVLPCPTTLPRYWASGRTFQMTQADATGDKCIETEGQITFNEWIYNRGAQWNFASKKFSVFQYNSPGPGHWVPVANIPLPDFSSPVGIILEQEVDEANHQVIHKAITVVVAGKSTTYPIGITLPAAHKPGAKNKFTAAMQLDMQDFHTVGELPPVCGVNISGFSESYLSI